MKEHEKDHLAEIKDIDESSVEELAEMYPMLGKSAKQRILEKCLEKTDETEFQEGITVSGDRNRLRAAHGGDQFFSQNIQKTVIYPASVNR